ncbi:hypothetical protein [Absidia glauca]|uniref:Uncharacterized protein n=1 Tax=Absidia glauca TaxID=4829 RepID=A0A163JAS6_ABSGL|nr:hypothetical protein [Absidia glauca]
MWAFIKDLQATIHIAPAEMTFADYSAGSCYSCDESLGRAVQKTQERLFRADTPTISHISHTQERKTAGKSEFEPLSGKFGAWEIIRCISDSQCTTDNATPGGTRSVLIVIDFGPCV